jgi:hemerythrin-like domain-containing protein
MANEIKPIKRSVELTPLSREHHEGLLLVWKVRQGIKNKVAPERMVAYLQWFWQHFFAPHFKQEETVVPQVLTMQHALVQQMFDEHQRIEQTIQGMNAATSANQLEELVQLVSDHIRFEERQLFNEVEQVATEEQMRQLSHDIKDEKSIAVWTDEFWLRGNQGT